jgi:hypothetical protein
MKKITQSRRVRTPFSPLTPAELQVRGAGPDPLPWRQGGPQPVAGPDPQPW